MLWDWISDLDHGKNFGVFGLWFVCVLLDDGIWKRKNTWQGLAQPRDGRENIQRRGGERSQKWVKQDRGSKGHGEQQSKWV